MTRLHAGRARALIVAAFIPALATCASVREVVEGSGQPTSYLLCPRTGPVPPAQQVRVGTSGVVMRNGPNELHIPAGALAREVMVTFGEVPGDTVGVTLNTEDEPFTRPVRLTIGMERCAAPGTNWAIWRVRPNATPEQLRTQINPALRTATTHFVSHSGFVIASRDRP
jgi:hypothetical protein